MAKKLLLRLPALLSDIDLWHSFKKGDRDAFGELFRRHYSTIFRYGSKLCADPNVVEDCIQELFVELWQGNATVSIKSVKAYLLTSIKYKLFRVHRDRPVRSADEINDHVAFEISHDNFMIGQEDQQEKARMVLSALKHLPGRQKEIIYLRIYQSLDYDEISEVMGISYQAARNLFSQSIKSLRKYITR